MSDLNELNVGPRWYMFNLFGKPTVEIDENE